MAWHFEEAGLRSKAIDYLIIAGEKAVRGYAYQEAITLFNRALALLNPLSENPEHTRRELSLQIVRGNALIVTEGFAAPEVEKAFARAWELCQRVEGSPQQFPVLFGYGHFTPARSQVPLGES